MSFSIIRLGKTSVSDIKTIDSNKEWSTVATELSVTCSQVPTEFKANDFGLIWLGSDNDAGAPTAWKKGLRAIAKVISVNRTGKHNDPTTIKLSVGLTFPASVEKDDMLIRAASEYALCRKIPIIGLNNTSNQTIQLVNEKADGEDISALFRAITNIHTSFKEKTIIAYPELEALFNLPVPRIPESSTAKTIATPHALAAALTSELTCRIYKNCTNIKLKTKWSDLKTALAALASKNFLIFTGLSGSGKTKLAEAIARWLCPKCYPSHHIMIAVGADWTSNENIMGYPHGIDDKKYIQTKALDLIIRAKDDSKNPYFLILDEMNMSHVERYFADILSAIESPDSHLNLYQGAGRKTDNELDIPDKINLPKNLFIIGTVNVDETTYQFSPKVLDRANVIEFRMESTEMASFLSNPSKPNLEMLSGLGAEEFGETFVNAAKSQETLTDPVKSEFASEMNALFDILKKHGAEFGYRTAYEASRFVKFYQVLGNHPGETPTTLAHEYNADSGKFETPTNARPWFDHAMDAVVIQKILPKLHGSRSKLEKLLVDLSLACATKPGEAAPTAEDARHKKEPESDSVRLKKLHDDTTFKARYPMSYCKLKRMLEKLRAEQFVSFAEA